MKEARVLKRRLYCLLRFRKKNEPGVEAGSVLTCNTKRNETKRKTR